MQKENLRVLACGLFLLSFVFKSYAQDATFNEIELDAIDLPNLSGYFLKAKVQANDNYLITVFSEKENKIKGEREARPCTEITFKKALQSAFEDLVAMIKSSDSAKAVSVKATIDKYTDLDFLRLFYQLRKADLATSNASTRPIAGYLHFSKKLTVNKTNLDPFFQMQKEKRVNEFMKTKWAELGESSNTIPKNIKRSLKREFEKNEIQINNEIAVINQSREEGDYEIEKKGNSIRKKYN